MKCKRHIRQQAGFTLIEIMVVVVVIALLGAMIGPTLFNKVQQAEQTRIAQDIRTIESALKFYRLDNYRFPTQAQGLEVLMTAPNDSENWNGPYLEDMPDDPWGEPYGYSYPGEKGKDIDVFTLGADGQTGGEDSDEDIGNWDL